VCGGGGTEGAGGRLAGDVAGISGNVVGDLLNNVRRIRRARAVEHEEGVRKKNQKQLVFGGTKGKHFNPRYKIGGQRAAMGVEEEGRETEGGRERGRDVSGWGTHLRVAARR
jgi:hypothetical protein